MRTAEDTPSKLNRDINMKKLSNSPFKVPKVIADYLNMICSDIRSLGYYCYHKNMENGRVPHVVLEVPKEINGEMYFQKFSVCYFHKKKEVRLFNNYGIFDRPQTCWAFNNSLELRDYLLSQMKDETLVKYSYTK
ncbi:hypothetical protein [Vibrio phage Va2]|nr:hypothetical protein [Vibrio phage Va2]